MISISSLISGYFRVRPGRFGGLGRALSSRDYRLYACGHIAHVHGWWGNKLGLGWLTWELTGSAGWLGIVAFAGMIPVMLIAPFAGALTDRVGHRNCAMLAGGVASLVSGAIAVLALSGRLDLILLISLAITQGLFFGIEFPARQSLIAQLVGRENISAAIAFNTTVFQVGAFVGPVLAGILISTHGAGAAVLLFSASSVWMAFMMFLVRHRNPLSKERRDAGLLSDITDGFRYIAGNTSLRLLFLISFSSGFLLRPYIDLLPGFSDEIFHRGAEGLAMLNAVAGLGALVFGVFLIFRGRTKGLARIMMMGACCTPVLLALFAATTLFNVALAVLAFAAMMLIATHVCSYSLVQNLIDPAMRGRVISINAAISIGSPALGALMMGTLAEFIGLRPALATTAILALLAAMALVPSVRRHAADMEIDP
jgi:MFS family permease